MIDNKKWFTEIHEKNGSAFSLRITKKLAEEVSPYQKIEIYETEKFGNLMTIDGFYMLSTFDNFLYHEMMSHPVLFTHANPKNIVIIGGGDCGTLQQVLLHKEVESVTQIDIDKKVTELAEKYFKELCSSNHDPRANIKFDDGVKWMQEAKSASVDVIIVDSTDPIGPGEGLFNKAFYTECRRVLRNDGLLIQQSESPLYHLNTILLPMKQAMQQGGFETTRTIFFPQPVYPSGWWSATIAGRGDLASFREDAAKNKNFKTKYYNKDIHKSALACPEFMC